MIVVDWGRAGSGQRVPHSIGIAVRSLRARFLLGTRTSFGRPRQDERAREACSRLRAMSPAADTEGTNADFRSESGLAVTGLCEYEGSVEKEYTCPLDL